MRRVATGGFSLIELAVSIGIIGLLIGILVPAVASFRRAAKVTRCASNLRQIGQFIHMYRADHRAWPYATAIPEPFKFPAPDGWPLAAPVPKVLTRYVPSASGIYRCPGDDTDRVFDRCESAAAGTGISYIYEAPFGLSGPDAILMNDFQGYAYPNLSVLVPMFHPPRVGMNTMLIDGSVTFGNAGR